MAEKEIFDFNQMKVPNVSPNLIKYVAIAILILIVLFNGTFMVEAQEVGVVIRFGKYSHTVESGLHFMIPFVDSVEKVAIKEQLKQEFGFRTEEAGIRTRYSMGNFLEESQMLTGDLNAAEVEWTVQYRITDAYKYLFKVRGVESTFRAMSEAMMRQVVGDRTVDEVITFGRQDIEINVQNKLQALCDEYETGIRVVQVILQDALPPEKVKPSFNEVNQAEQERDRLINEAETEYNKVIPRSQGEAQKVIEEAKGYALERVNKAQGEAARFNSLYSEYRKAKDVTRQRIYLETLNKILPKTGKKLIVDEKIKGLIPLLDLKKEVIDNAK